jgi:hypothetical protein
LIDTLGLELKLGVTSENEEALEKRSCLTIDREASFGMQLSEGYMERPFLIVELDQRVDPEGSELAES